MNAIARYFDFDTLGTNWRTESVAGLTTFLSMAYILFVNPAVLSLASVPDAAGLGMPRDAVFTATAVAAAFGPDELVADPERAGYGTGQCQPSFEVHAICSSASISSSARYLSSSVDNTARKASCGISTLPSCFIRFLPSFCFSRSLRLRDTSPP